MLWVAVAVAVYAHVVHHVYIHDISAVLFEIVVHRLSGSSHRLKKSVLVAHMLPHAFQLLLITCGVDISLALCRGNAYALVFEHSTESSHLMTFEMGEIDHEIIVCHV